MTRALAALAFLAVVAGCHLPPHAERGYYKPGQRWRIHLQNEWGLPCTVVLRVRAFEKPELVGTAESDTCGPVSAEERRIDLTHVQEMEGLVEPSEVALWGTLQLFGEIAVLAALSLLVAL